MKKSIENLSGRKYTGGRKIAARSRRKYEIDRYPNEAIVGNNMKVERRVRGNNSKTALKTGEFANISNLEDQKTTKSKILRVIKNTANKDYERRGVITKGTLIETEIGLARVVSRPGQVGIINAVHLKK
ncbi:MAG: 30S ribosomal protein S8e [Thaumarchaeota archaeon]|nr:MAG: 30S ribosomal protein S8e [Nitrososphaerota archaeon]TLX90520.1 MAG: 30S ribosomal protein S8e [Nitrososphaerota archaeon]